MFCPTCKGPMTPMMVSWFCPRDCDRIQAKPDAPVADFETKPAIFGQRRAKAQSNLRHPIGMQITPMLPYSMFVAIAGKKEIARVFTSSGIGVGPPLPSKYRYAKWWGWAETEDDTSTHSWIVAVHGLPLPCGPHVSYWNGINNQGWVEHSPGKYIQGALFVI